METSAWKSEVFQQILKIKTFSASSENEYLQTNSTVFKRFNLITEKIYTVVYEGWTFNSPTTQWKIT